ncbi:glucokinase [Melioribacter roseus P3M-2]|uniref:Glucokinase n=1 Tax=Melioribacter roseus (strain DSM 23840 / JCM 17771 / VKM B-2668 / P3M-2) TaxID=1191523 RepID=I6YX35_MELRP|nr:ROK family protein [Melioribacter roseus]AFN75147.1 glucokinase [Melioribacter roseus P3M-2]
MSREFIISVDLGGTKILTALVDKDNNIVSRIKIPTSLKKGADGLVDSISESVTAIIRENSLTEKNIKAVAMGVPGTVNPFTGIIDTAPNLGINNFNIKEALSSKISMPVLIENDVNLAGLGIKKFEFGDEVKNMLVVFIGTGIGGALFFDGKIYRGSSFYAGEIGHMLVDKKGAFATKPKRRTFEKTASRTAIEETIIKEIRKGKDSILRKYVESGKKLKSKVLLEALKKQDKLTVKVLSKAATVTGTVLGSLTTLLNFDTIVLGGGVVEAMEDFILPIIKASFYNGVLPAPGKIVEIRATKLGDDAAIYGGIALAEEFLK